MCQVLWRKFFDVIGLVTARDEDVETMTEGALSELMARVKSSQFDGSLSKRGQRVKLLSAYAVFTELSMHANQLAL
jgi:hypothetical protein